MTTDIITTLLTWPEPDLTSAQLAEVLGVSRSSVTEAIRLGNIEALTLDMRARKGQRHRHRRRIAKTAAIRWIWRNTTGDKATLRAALEEHAPSILKRLQTEDAQTKRTPVRRPSEWHPNQLALFKDEA